MRLKTVCEQDTFWQIQSHIAICYVIHNSYLSHMLAYISFMLYKNTLGLIKVRPGWKHHLILMFIHATIKGLLSGRGQGLLRFNHFIQLFTIACKQTADIVVANNNLQELFTMINARM